MLILYAILAACFLGGAAFVWHGIGASAVTKHEQEVKVEQDKQDAVAKVKQEAAADTLIDMQAAYEKGQSEREIVEKKIYVRGQAYAVETPVFQNKECVVPAQGLAILNGARGDLQNSTVADIFGFNEPAPVTIKPPPKIVVVPVPAPVAAPQPQTGSRPPKPVPIGPAK